MKGGPQGAVEEPVELQPISPFPSRSYQMRLQSLLVPGEPRSSLPWTLVGASVLLLAITLYLFFGAYLPARQRLVRLELELKQLYAREAQLQTQVAQQEKLHARHAQQVSALTAERDGLARRIEELERQLARGDAPPRRR